jgi:hypothetical protein
MFYFIKGTQAIGTELVAADGGAWAEVGRSDRTKSVGAADIAW